MRWMPVTLAILAGVACGSPPPPATARRVRASRAPTNDGCPATETRIVDACWSAEGTRWRVEADGPGGEYRFDVELMAANRARANDHEAASPATDEWFQDGPLLRILLSDRFVEYRARVTNGTVLVGEAWNVRDQRWSWRAQRLFGEVSCPASETRVDGACMSAAGTRWRVDGDGVRASSLELLGEGQAFVTPEDDRPTSEEGRWTQVGAEVRVELEDGGAMTMALDDADAMRGSWSTPDAGERRIRATRLETFPPVMHR